MLRTHTRSPLLQVADNTRGATRQSDKCVAALRYATAALKCFAPISKAARWIVAAEGVPIVANCVEQIAKAPPFPEQEDILAFAAATLKLDGGCAQSPPMKRARHTFTTPIEINSNPRSQARDGKTMAWVQRPKP